MKRTVFAVAAGVLAYVLLHILFNDSPNVSDRKVELASEGDSLSFAVSMMIGEEMPLKMQDVGIDSTTIDDFIRGLCDAFPLDDTAESRAYANGVLVASSAMEMMELADEAIYPGDTINKVNRKIFLEGLKAAAYRSSKTIDIETARDYYNQHVFRAKSDEFIRNNKGRPGVVTLPSGVQYKIETEGNGPVAKHGDVVKCIYKGTYPNGSTFDSSRGFPVEKRVGDMVPGLAEIVMTLPAGTQCKAYIPWELGYGAKGSRGIAPYSALVYDLEIVEVVAGK
ncbi:MAG: FKBP-type peptidyl-prolyl cis-trans isomerase [Bacteroidaceae bacterium]|nr:FKBP-type peptidyl-prolyl cis-trans isomerase [Bacteroidaceae bacterium]